MTTSIELSEEELAALREATGEHDAAKGLRIAFQEYVRYVLREQLIAMAGTVEMTDDWRALDEAELAERRRDAQTGLD